MEAAVPQLHQGPGSLYGGSGACTVQTPFPLEKQGLVQSFEFTQELSWKVLKDFLEYQGAATGILGSKDAIPRGFAAGLISDGDTWMDMIASRNLASHTYNQETADEILQKCVESYAPQFQQLQKRLEAEL